MKTAIVVTGYLPYFRETFSNIQNKILSKFSDYDVFLSTWDLKDEDKKDFISLYNPVLIDNELYTEETKYILKNNLRYIQSIPGQSNAGASPHSIAMWYKLSRGFNMVDEYALEKNKNYDLIIRLRTDFIFTNSLTSDEITNTLKGVIYVGPHCGADIGLNGNGHAADNFMLFNNSNLELFKNLYPNYFYIWDQYKCYTPEHVLYTYLKNSLATFRQTNLKFARLYQEKTLTWNVNNTECFFPTLELANIQEDFYINENFEITNL